LLCLKYEMLTKLIWYRWLFDHFWSSLAKFVPSIRTSVFRMELGKKRKKFSIAKKIKLPFGVLVGANL
jgi:hypothetical protein